LARAAAPVLGGVLTVRATWRWCFYVNLSLVGVIAAVILFFMQNFTPYTSERSIRQIFAKLDYYGIALIVSGSICLLLGLNWGGVIYPVSLSVCLHRSMKKMLTCCSGIALGSYSFSPLVGFSSWALYLYRYGCLREPRFTLRP
jgi:hypothetical protein